MFSGRISEVRCAGWRLDLAAATAIGIPLGLSWAGIPQLNQVVNPVMQILTADQSDRMDSGGHHLFRRRQ